MEDAAPVVYFEITLRMPGTSKKVAQDLYSIDADKDRTRLAARIMQSPELDRLVYLSGQIRQYGYRHTFKGLFKRGVFLLPAALIPKVQADMEANLVEWEEAVDAFIARYEELVAQDRISLGVAFKPENYRGAYDLRQRFGLSWSYRSAGVEGQVPAILGSISGDLYAQEQAKVKQQWAEVLEDAKQTLWAELVESVKGIGDKLSDATDKLGRPQRINQDFTKKFEEFLGLFGSLNITNDQGLQELAERAKKIMEGMPDAPVLRDNAALKAEIRSQLQTVQADAERYMVAKPRRGFASDED